MLKRRLKQVGFPAHYSPHSFRATGITNFLENGRMRSARQSSSPLGLVSAVPGNDDFSFKSATKLRPQMVFGRLEHARQMAGHESPRTTKLYDRTKDEITLSVVERIRL
jgi:integrase/recombinase XerD